AICPETPRPVNLAIQGCSGIPWLLGERVGKIKPQTSVDQTSSFNCNTSRRKNYARGLLSFPAFGRREPANWVAPHEEVDPLQGFGAVRFGAADELVFAPKLPSQG